MIMGNNRNIFKLAVNNVSMINSIFLKHRSNSFNNNVISFQVRYIKIYPLTNNFQYISKDSNMNIKIDQKTMKLNKPINKPLCYMFTWLSAKNFYIEKYANIYLDKGFDIFNVKCSASQILFPTKGAQVVAKNVLKFMEQNKTYDPIVIQGFSVGGYIWGEVCKIASEDLNRYQPLMDKFVCQIWDSVADFNGFKNGVAGSQFKNNMLLQKLVYKYIELHLLVFKKFSTVHYLTSRKYFLENLIKAPCLFMYSNTDIIATLESHMDYKACFENLGIKVTMICFENSPHVQHLRTYPEKYLKSVEEHLIANVPTLKRS